MKRYCILLFIALVALVIDSKAQNITGSASVVVGQTVTYTFTDGNIYVGTVTWGTGGFGSVLSQSNVGSTYTASIQWTSLGTASLTFLDNAHVGRGNLSVTITVGIPNTTFTVAQSCLSTNITRTTSPPSGVNWYWQTSSSGTSTTSLATTYTVSTANTFYLRARWGTTGAWSTNSQSTPAVTILSQPAVPATSTDGNIISNVPNSIPLSVGSVSGANLYNWYTLATGGTLLNSQATPTYSPVLTTPGTSVDYYVASVNSNTNGSCESSTRKKVTAGLHPEPLINVTNGGIVNLGQSVTMSVSNYTYDTYTWLDENGNAISGATSSSYTTNVVGMYKLRVTKGNAAPFTSSGQTLSSYNYIVSANILVDGINNDQDVANLAVTGKSQSIQYFDGIGRPNESVNWQASPTQKDIVQPTAYDAFGREKRKYLPYASTENNGWFKINPVGTTTADYSSSAQYLFYNNGVADKIVDDTKPYAETVFEPSPLSRPVEQGSPGNNWQPDGTDSYTSTDRTVKFSAEVNDANEVIQWAYTLASPTSPINVTNAGYYPANTLFRNKTKDEQYNEVIEYKDKEGRVVLKKVQAPGGVWAQTYYLYDDAGNLVVVLPPQAVIALLN